MPPTHTAVAGDDSDPKKIVAVLAIIGTGYKIYRGRKVGFSELMVAATALWGLFGPQG
jgi:type IV secretory pathway VirB2 component (pilin)